MQLQKNAPQLSLQIFLKGLPSSMHGWPNVSFILQGLHSAYSTISWDNSQKSLHLFSMACKKIVKVLIMFILQNQ